MSDGGSKELERSPLDRVGDRWHAGWGGGGRDDFALCCTVDILYEDPLSDGLLEGVDALDRHATRMRDAFPDLRVEATGQRIADRGFGCLPWKIAGTQRGELGDIPATNRYISLHGLHYVELRDDLICRARGFFDTYDAATQLGLLPKTGSLAQNALLMIQGFGLRIRR
jgi:predicted ester cyclase